MRLKYPPALQRTRTNYIRRVRGTVKHIAPPPGWHKTTLRILPRASGSSSGKREPRVISSSTPSIMHYFMGALTLNFTLQYHGVSQPLGMCDGEVGSGFQQLISTQIVADQAPTCGAKY